MSVMIETWLRSPIDPARLSALYECVSQFRGQPTFREANHQSTCYTIEFADWDTAKGAEVVLRKLADHVEGPMDYGDSHGAG